MTNLAIQNIRNRVGDAACIKAYAQYLVCSRRTKSHSGTMTAMSARDMAGRAAAAELGLTDEQVETGR